MTQKCSCHGSGDKHSQTVAAVLERPRYSPGLILEDSDLTSAVDYTRSLSRLLFRNLFGCGVVCGLVVTVDEDCGLAVTVAPGLALDGCGDPIEVPRPITITLGRTEVEALEKQSRDDELAEFWVVLCGREKLCAPRALVCDADEFDGVSQPTRIRALAEVSLAFERPECLCACGPPQDSAANDATREPVDDEIDCHRDHETRVECGPDCGCGTACACGCCLLLARIYRGQSQEGGAIKWMARNRGIRRTIGPKLLPDPADRDEGWTSDMAAKTVFMGAPAGRDAGAANSGGFAGIKRGQLLTQGKIIKIIAEEEKLKAAHPPLDAAPAVDLAAAGANRPAVATEAAVGKKKPATTGEAEKKK